MHVRLTLGLQGDVEPRIHSPLSRSCPTVFVEPTERGEGGVDIFMQLMQRHDGFALISANETLPFLRDQDTLGGLGTLGKASRKACTCHTSHCHTEVDLVVWLSA